MKCRTARQKIGLLVGNDLSQSDIGPVQEHIAECAPCRQHVEDIMDSSDILTAYGSESLSQRRTSVWENVIEQLPPQPESSPQPPPRRHLRHSILVVAAVLVITIVGILPDLLPRAGFMMRSGIQVTHPASIELPAGEYVRHYSDNSWQALEVLDGTPRNNARGPVRNVVGF